MEYNELISPALEFVPRPQTRPAGSTLGPGSGTKNSGKARRGAAGATGSSPRGQRCIWGCSKPSDAPPREDHSFQTLLLTLRLVPTLPFAALPGGGVLRARRAAGGGAAAWMGSRCDAAKAFAQPGAGASHIASPRLKDRSPFGCRHPTSPKAPATAWRCQLQKRLSGAPWGQGPTSCASVRLRRRVPSRAAGSGAGRAGARAVGGCGSQLTASKLAPLGGDV